MSTLDEKIIIAVIGSPLPEGAPTPNFVEKIKQIFHEDEVRRSVKMLEKFYNTGIENSELDRIADNPLGLSDESIRSLREEEPKVETKIRLQQRLNQTDSQVEAGENAPESEDTPLKDNTP